MRWTVHGERSLYESDWVRLRLVDVEIPGVARFDHHVVRLPAEASGTVVRDPDRGVLLLWRHRFIPDAWGWEIPAGRIDEGESPEEAAVRETTEETGWRPTGLRHLVTYQPMSGLSDQRFHLFLASGAEHIGEPAEPWESERIEWVPVPEVARLAQHGQMPDGLSLTAVLYSLLFAESLF